MADSTPKSNIGRFPVDLTLTVILGVWMIIGASEFSDVWQVVLGTLAVLFIPGYALVTALFPRSNSGVFAVSGTERYEINGEVTLVERFVLAVALSVCIVPLVGIGMNYTPQGIRIGMVIRSIGFITISLSCIALIRRFTLSPEERFNPSVKGLLFSPVSVARQLRTGSIVTILLAGGLVLAATGIGFAVVGVDYGERFTEFYLATEDPETGDLVAGGYPDQVTRGESESVQVGISNNEGRTVEYTTVVLLQSISENGEIQATQRLDAFRVTLEDNETVVRTQEIRPELAGEDLRVTFLLYKGSPPNAEEVGTDTAYRQAHFWIDVPTQSSE